MAKFAGIGCADTIESLVRRQEGVRGVMADDTALDVAKRDIEACMRLIASRRGSAYRAAWRVWGTAMRHATDSDTIMWPLWLMWGALTDWVEQRPAETEQAVSAMARAALEWLSLPENGEIQRAYFDRWLYDELGYERPSVAPDGSPRDAAPGAAAVDGSE